MTQTDYNRARHMAANQAIGDLVDAVPRDADTPAPAIARHGDGAVRYFSPPQGVTAAVAA